MIDNDHFQAHFNADKHIDSSPCDSVAKAFVEVPTMASNWVVAHNHVASTLFVEEIEHQLAKYEGTGRAYMLDLANVTLNDEADALKMLSIVAENDKLSSTLVGFSNCSPHTSMLLSHINCALPCLAPDMSFGSGRKSLLSPASVPLAAHEDAVSHAAGTPTPAPVSAPTTTAVSTFTYFGAVRSGQQVYSPGSASIVILGNVNNGGEVLSDGDIHIYGKLLGRVICGLKGSNNCTIYCRSFEPALVGISDAFIMVEDHMNELRSVIGKPVCVSYHSSNPAKSGHSAALRSTSNDSSSTSQVLKPTVTIPIGDAEGYVAFTILPS